MRLFLRRVGDRSFTFAAAACALLMIAALAIVLGPIVSTGASAVVFRGTVEFRKMQLERHGRGDRAKVEAEVAAVNKARAVVYETLDAFSAGIDTTRDESRIRRLYRQFKIQLRNRVEQGVLDEERGDALKRLAKTLRNHMATAYETTDSAEAMEHLQAVLACRGNAALAGTAAQTYAQLAEEYLPTAQAGNLARRRAQYAKPLGEVRQAVAMLFGPEPGERMPALVRLQYGSTRWDQTQVQLDKLLWATAYVPTEPGQPDRKVRTHRSEQFAGTSLEGLFGLIERNIDEMLLPKRTVYWSYFTDDMTTGHYFGGVGPEILGTLLVTVLAMLFAFPLGLCAAAYLVECARETFVVRIIRICINTLAGVPSIVFGLFGLAFFVLYVQPRLGLEAKPSILAGSLTMAVLVLPVIIRASEEAIRAVPRTYKEASLALGAGGLRTFMTVTFPAALPGVLTGVILSMSRAAGETAPLLFCAAVALGPVPGSIMEPTRTLSYGSYDIAVGDRLAKLVPHKQFGMVMTLIALVLILNTAAIIIRWRVSRKLRGQ